VAHNHAKWPLQQTEHHQNTKDEGTKIPSQICDSQSVSLYLGLASEGFVRCWASQFVAVVVIKAKAILVFCSCLFFSMI
jgi:hypothetical protein